MIKIYIKKQHQILATLNYRKTINKEMPMNLERLKIKALKKIFK